jgi:peptidoglycan/xylan/chitin deacetylase (PgdA/CDA1 family)
MDVSLPFDGGPPPYTGLAPFREWFESSGDLPMLMYHKLGPRPSRVRLKGLYVGTKLFETQMQELRLAGYSTCALDEFAATPGKLSRRIVISFDDGYTNVLKYGLQTLNKNGFQSIQYIVADAIGKENTWDINAGEAPEKLMDRVQIAEWLSGGQMIGSHGLSHACLTDVPRSQAREEIIASKRKLEDAFGVPIKHFCYPYGSWNNVIRDLVMEAGYTTACTTEYGRNSVDTPCHQLKRLTARYQSWSLKAIRKRFLS